MNEAKRKVGISPVTEEMIRSWVEDTEARNNDEAMKLFKSPVHHVPRVNTALSFFEDLLRIPIHEIEIIDVWMSNKPENGIMWIKADERFVKRVFYKASIVRDPQIKIWQYTPHETLKQKIRNDQILKRMRVNEKI